MISQPKWPALDALKFLCVAGMVLAHGFYWTWTQGGRFILPERNTYFATNVSSWHLADLIGVLGECLLMGVKRTKNEPVTRVHF